MKSLPLNGDTQSLMTEFSKRIGDMENKYEAMRKERDALKRSQDENVLKREIAKLNETLTTKQRDLDRYRSECDALNKRLSSSENELKKLLSDKKTYESHISSLSDKLAAATSLSESRAERIAQLELQERRSSDALEGLRDVSEASAKSQERWERKVSELTTQNADLQTALEKAWRDIAEVKMSHTQSQEAAEAELYEKTSRLQAEHKKALAQVKADAAAREEELTAGVTELRAALQRAEDDAAWREEEHAREVRELQKRTEAMEARGDAMASHALDSTLPLLRQIEALQQAATARAEASDEVLLHNIICLPLGLIPILFISLSNFDFDFNIPEIISDYTQISFLFTFIQFFIPYPIQSYIFPPEISFHFIPFLIDGEKAQKSA